MDELFIFLSLVPLLRNRICTAAAVLALVACTPGGQQAPRKPAAVPNPLPSGHLEFGLANQPQDLGWMVSSSVPWKYRYQYLAGGVNTGQGWEGWSHPVGSFATEYLTESGHHSYIPVFTYYEMLQSNPGKGRDDSEKDYTNLTNPTTMNAYYTNFALLMKKAREYGQLVVVQVEPDFWGYMEQRARGGDASTVKAAVSSSKFVDVASLPDTLQGFAWALLNLRDLYAPNVVLGIHASMWATGIDIATNTSASVSSTTQADRVAKFLDSAGITSNPHGSTWDVVFDDVDDHDAGWWEAQASTSHDYTHWWDPTNQTFPNFSRYLAWVAELKAQTNRPQVVWQVPIGNQYFLTENNTCGHYQDNVAQYLLAHTSDLLRAGLIAVLFGSGNSCQTTYTDDQKDGVTNNHGMPTTDHAGHCSACDTHTSVWADDDGGYLRVFVGRYYASLGPGSRSALPNS